MDIPVPTYTIDTLRNDVLVAKLLTHSGFMKFFVYLAKQQTTDADAILLRFFIMFDLENWIQDGEIALPAEFDPEDPVWRRIMYGSSGSSTWWITMRVISGKRFYYQYDMENARWEKINQMYLVEYIWNMLYDLYLNFMQYNPQIMSREDYLGILDHYHHHVFTVNKTYLRLLVTKLP